jgi:hypothetical protein
MLIRSPEIFSGTILKNKGRAIRNKLRFRTTARFEARFFSEPDASIRDPYVRIHPGYRAKQFGSGAHHGIFSSSSTCIFVPWPTPDPPIPNPWRTPGGAVGTRASGTCNQPFIIAIDRLSGRAAPLIASTYKKHAEFIRDQERKWDSAEKIRERRAKTDQFDQSN